MNENTSNSQIQQSVSHVDSDVQYEENGNISVQQRRGPSFIYLFPLLYVVVVYGMVFLFFAGEEGEYIFDHFIIILAFFGLLNALVAVLYCKPENRSRLFHSAIFMKYTLIPFFSVGGLIPVFGMMITFIPVPIMMFVGPFTVIFSSAMGWVVLAMQCPYMIAYLRLASGENEKISKWKVLHTILQFIFVADVLDVMVLTFIEKRGRKFTVAVWILMAIALFIIGVLVVLGILGIGILAYAWE